jgi:allophanate hydrolase
VHPDYPSGGSSAGSSLAVALGVASFALGTDTAGSGRVLFAPFVEAANLLYEGPWVAERYSVVGELVEANPEAVLPVIRDVLRRRQGRAQSNFFVRNIACKH